MLKFAQLLEESLLAVEFPTVRDAIADLGRGRTRVEEDSGLDVSHFMVPVDHLTQLLALQRFRSAPEPTSPPAVVRDDLRDAARSLSSHMGAKSRAVAGVLTSAG